MSLARLAYNALVIPLLAGAFRLASLFNSKVRRGIAGRKALFGKLERHLSETPEHHPLILVHAASMGEFEQARPVLRLLRREMPACRLCLSLFSPSAYEHLAARHEADFVTYLPFDSRANVRRFLDLLQPAAILVARHDIWPNLLWEARARGIFTVLFAASIHDGSLRQKPLVRQFNRNVFRSFDAVCTISEAAQRRMQPILDSHPGVHVYGDPRFDQVAFRAREKPLAELLPSAVLDWRVVMVAGSTWPEDEAQVLPAFAAYQRRQPEAKLIVVPHEPSADHVVGVEARCRELHLSPVRLSEFNESAGAHVLIIDRIGMLANLYGAGEIAFVGGGFGPGVHSVLEPAAHGCAVLFGPHMRNSAEAIDMVEEGCGAIVTSADEVLARLLQWLHEPGLRERLAEATRAFVAQRTGASERIVDLVVKQLTQNRG